MVNAIAQTDENKRQENERSRPFLWAVKKSKRHTSKCEMFIHVSLDILPSGQCYGVDDWKIETTDCSHLIECIPIIRYNRRKHERMTMKYNMKSKETFIRL